MDKSQRFNLNQIPFVFGETISLEHVQAVRTLSETALSLKDIIGELNKKFKVSSKKQTRLKSIIQKYKVGLETCNRTIEEVNKKNNNLQNLSVKGELYQKLCKNFTETAINMKTCLVDINFNKQEIENLEIQLTTVEKFYENIDQTDKSLSNLQLIENKAAEMCNLMQNIESCNAKIQESLELFDKNKNNFIHFNQETKLPLENICLYLKEYQNIADLKTQYIDMPDLPFSEMNEDSYSSTESETEIVTQEYNTDSYENSEQKLSLDTKDAISNTTPGATCEAAYGATCEAAYGATCEATYETACEAAYGATCEAAYGATCEATYETACEATYETACEAACEDICQDVNEIADEESRNETSSKNTVASYLNNF